MKINFDWKKLLPYVVAIIVFVGFSVLYCAPLLDGKVLYAGDTNNWKGVSHQTKEYTEQTGEVCWWTGSLFGGMPTYQIDAHIPSHKVSHGWTQNVLHVGLNETMGIIFGYFLCFYILLLCFGVNPWLSIVGALAMGLSSYFFLIIPAGHTTKALALGFLPAIIGGVYQVFRKNYWVGAPIIFIFGVAGVILHPQMTYYIFMLLGVLGCAELYIHIREKRWIDLCMGLGVIALCFMLVCGTKMTWWKLNQEYLSETMRGGHSELGQTNDEGKDTKSVGLDIDYATAWSYGKAETMTLLIPNYMGGCSGYDLGENSQLEQDLKKMGVPARQAKGFCQGAPTYWGEKAFTSGPVYVGAIICLLFVLGLLIVPGPYKWALLIATLFSITLAWGRNFMGWTELFYNYFPMYNKFRAVESILVVAEVTIPLLAMLALKRLTEIEDDKQSRKMILIAGGIVSAICLFVALFGGGFDVTSSYDASWKGQVGDRIYSAILDQRHQMMTSSAWRSLAFVVAGTAVLLFYTWKKNMKNSAVVLAAALLALVLVDMVPVDRHFFGEQNFVSKKDGDRFFAMQPWEEQILQDKSLDFRVLNLNTNTFNDARTSYRLKSIGGYHAAKLRRYQDLIDAHISRNNFQVLNMLNTKYIITRNGVQLNSQAFGNAWFVDEVQFVDTPDEESQALWNLDLRKTAVADRKFEEQLAMVNRGSIEDSDRTLIVPDVSPADEIEMTSYAPDKLEYKTTTSSERIAVFSEIYYPHGWHLYIDGEEASISRVNYVLRAAIIPTGEHTVVMEFVPDALRLDPYCMVIAILGLIASLLSLAYYTYKRIVKK